VGALTLTVLFTGEDRLEGIYALLPATGSSRISQLCGTIVRYFMQEPSYYRAQALRARRLAEAITDPQAEEALKQLAHDYEEIADDLERENEIDTPPELPETERF
jgi:hypothetical protein